MIIFASYFISINYGFIEKFIKRINDQTTNYNSISYALRLLCLTFGTKSSSLLLCSLTGYLCVLINYNLLIFGTTLVC